MRKNVHEGILAVTALLSIQDGDEMFADLSRERIAQEPLQERNQLLTLRWGTILKNLVQEALKTRRAGIQPRPCSGAGGAHVILWLAITQLAGAQVDDAIGTGEQPAILIPLLAQDAEVRVDFGESDDPVNPAHR